MKTEAMSVEQPQMLLHDWVMYINILCMKKLSVHPTIFYSTTLASVLMFLPIISEAQIKYEVKSLIKFGSIEELVVGILNIFIVIATPIIVLFIIYAGFLYVTARGNAQQVQQATRALTYAIIGGILILGAVALSEVLSNTINAFKAP